MIAVHHDPKEIHQVMERVKKDGNHHWWDILFGWSPTAPGIFNKMLRRIIVLLKLTPMLFILVLELYFKMWRIMIWLPPRFKYNREQ